MVCVEGTSIFKLGFIVIHFRLESLFVHLETKIQTKSITFFPLRGNEMMDRDEKDQTEIKGDLFYETYKNSVKSYFPDWFPDDTYFRIVHSCFYYSREFIPLNDWTLYQISNI